MQGASVTMVPNPGSPFHVCQDWGRRENRNMLVSPAVGAETDMCVPLYVCVLHVCVPGTHPGSPGLSCCMLTEARHTT